MTMLPDYEQRLIPEGTYAFNISTEPEVRRSRTTDDRGKSRETLNVKVKLLVDLGNGRQTTHTEVFFVHEPRYRDFLLAIGCKRSDDGHIHTPESFDVIGRSFVADLIHEPNKKDPSRVWARVTNFKLGNEDDDIPAPNSATDDDIPF